MTESTAVDQLSERIKELQCLYDISNIAGRRSDDLNEIVQDIVFRVSKAWKYPEDAVAEIKLEECGFSSGIIPQDAVVMSEGIVPDREQVGTIKVYYPAIKYTRNDFLQEERQLLKKIANEIAVIYERFQVASREEVLKRSAERNDRLSILGEITAGIAHELNTPLGNILGFAELIVEKSSEAQVQKDAQKITDSAIYAREVVKKLMFFSCEMPQQRASVAVNAILQDAIKLLNPTLKSASVNLEFEPDPRNPFARLDPIQITQVVFNLLINAIYASPPNGTIRVALSSNANHIQITIADEGQGIPEEVRDKIFEPFFTTKPQGEGSGLGLSVVHGIVKSHQGSIQFSSDDDKGTTFNVILPVHP